MTFYNERMLNGGQQGSGSGLDADKVDGTESSGLKGMNSEEKATRLAVLSDIAELRAAQSMNVDDYNRLFVDAFVDNSRIASSNKVNITTGTNGRINLAKVLSGNTSTSSTSSLVNATTGSASSHPTSYDTLIVPNDSVGKIVVTGSSGNTGIQDAQIYDTNGAPTDSSQWTSVSSVVSTSGNGDVTFDNLNLEAGKTYAISYTLNGDIEIWGSATTSTYGEIDASTDYAYIVDSVEFHELQQATSGSITSTSKTVDTAPDTIQVYQDANLNGQDIQYTVKDGNGNSETITQSEVGQSIDVSSKFTGTSMTTEVNLSGDGSTTPVLNEYGVDY